MCCQVQTIPFIILDRAHQGWALSPSISPHHTTTALVNVTKNMIITYEQHTSLTSTCCEFKVRLDHVTTSILLGINQGPRRFLQGWSYSGSAVSSLLAILLNESDLPQVCSWVQREGEGKSGRVNQGLGRQNEFLKLFWFGSKKFYTLDHIKYLWILRYKS